MKKSKSAIAVICAVLMMSGMTLNLYAAETKAPYHTDLDVRPQDDSKENENNEVKVKLYESYDAAYDLYEESMDDMFFFYSNVGNGSFTSDPVSLDFPANFNYEMEKDGVAVPYTSGDKIEEAGNYVVRISVDYEGTVYTSTFRFSLKEKADSADSAKSQETTDRIPLSEEDLVIDPNDTISDEDIDRMIENASKDLYLANGEEAVNVNSYSGIATSFNSETMLYNLTLQSGDVVVSNVPNGAVINNNVVITVPDGITASVYKNGEPLSDNETFNFTEPGFYRVVFSSDKSTFYRFYQDESRYPYITFRILGQSVNDLEVFTAPLGCKIVEIHTDTETIKNEKGETSLNLDSYWMEEEGTYYFRIFDPMADATYTVTVTRDVTAPSGDIELTKSSANIILDSGDVERIDVIKDGTLQEYKGKKITGKGNYVVNIYDKAGNVTTLSFSLVSGFNVGTFMTFILLLGLIIACFLRIRSSRTNINIR